MAYAAERRTGPAAKGPGGEKGPAAKGLGGERVSRVIRLRA